MDKTIVQVLQEVATDICNNFCKYQDTETEDEPCVWIKNGGKCPLDKIN